MSERKGYGVTPNKIVPLNDREQGEIAEIAWKQLKPYSDAADTWPIRRSLRDARACNICKLCNQNLWFDRDENSTNFKYTEAEIKTLIVAHIRQRHTDDNGVIDLEATGECEILDISRRNDPDRVSHNNAS